MRNSALTGRRRFGQATKLEEFDTLLGLDAESAAGYSYRHNGVRQYHRQDYWFVFCRHGGEYVISGASRKWLANPLAGILPFLHFNFCAFCISMARMIRYLLFSFAEVQVIFSFSCAVSRHGVYEDHLSVDLLFDRTASCHHYHTKLPYHIFVQNKKHEDC